MYLRVRASSLSLALAVTLSLLGSSRAGAAPAEGPLGAPEADPVGVHNGQEVMPCAWPTAVAVSSNGALCTGTLVHPRLVIFAAHCGGEPKKILFGQKVSAPFKTISSDLCMAYPGYGGVNDQEHDWAFCRLAQSVDDVPVTPVVYGCETEIVTPGREVAVVGFGITEQDGDAGVKNWGLTPIHNVYSGAADVGGGNDPGICPGDSGGPAFVRYPDNSWHVFGIASTLTGQCGGLGTHSLVWNAVPWIEEESGIDITPCHDVDGTWNPDFRCSNFYAGEPGVGYGEFTNWCPGTPANGASATCGSPFDASPDQTPPTVTITTPVTADYPDLTSFETSIEIDAQDGDGWGVVEVRIKINGDEQPGGDVDAPYGFPKVAFPKGTFELVAVAEDAAGLISESQPVILKIGPVETPAETTDGESTSAPETSEVTGDADSDPPTSGAPTDGGDEEGPGTNATTPTAPLSTTDVPMEGDDSSCGCQATNTASSLPWLLVLLGGIRRRRPLAG